MLVHDGKVWSRASVFVSYCSVTKYHKLFELQQWSRCLGLGVQAQLPWVYAVSEAVVWMLGGLCSHQEAGLGRSSPVNSLRLSAEFSPLHLWV